MLSPISNLFGYLLNFLYDIVNNNFGIAIILFSVLLRLILLPITIKQQKSVKQTAKIQEQLKVIQFKYKDNPEQLNKATMELYKKEGVSPFSGCLSGIVQILIILAVFYLVSEPLTYMKKANESNPELKAVVDEYKKEISESTENKTRYIEIATISKINEDYNNICEKIDNSNADKTNEAEENVEEQKENTDNKNITEQEDNSQNADAEKQEETKPQEENNQQEEQSLEEMESRKNILEKLRVNMEFCGLNLSKVPNENLSDVRVYIIPILYVISSFVSIRLTSSKGSSNKKEKSENNSEEDAMQQMNKSMSYMMPIMTLSIAFIAPLGLALYWFVSNVLMICERLVINKVMDTKEAE